MKMKIVVRSKAFTSEVFWLYYNGTSLKYAFGSIKGDSDASTGRLAMTRRGQVINEELFDVAEDEDFRVIVSFAVVNPRNFANCSFPKLTDGRFDTIMTLDVRTLPPGCIVNFTVGFLAPGNLAPIAAMVGSHPTLAPLQVMIAPEMVPWVLQL